MAVRDDRAVSDARLLAIKAVESHVRAFLMGMPWRSSTTTSDRHVETVPDLRVLVARPPRRQLGRCGRRVLGRDGEAQSRT